MSNFIHSMHRRQFALLLLAVFMAAADFAPAQDTPPGKIELSKMKPTGLLVDKYSYMAPPYNFYYFHHIADLGFRTDLVRKPPAAYPLKEPTRRSRCNTDSTARSTRLTTIYGATM